MTHIIKIGEYSGKCYSSRSQENCVSCFVSRLGKTKSQFHRPILEMPFSETGHFTKNVKS